MLLLVDGYNLLHVSGLFGPASGPPTLESSRAALLEFLATRLPEAVRRKATIVFDAASAPPGLPSHLELEGMTVRFAPRKQTADDVIAVLIGQEPDPRNLTVVSSDHAVQRAARQRGAKFVDSQDWFRQLQRATADASAQGEDKPSAPLGNPFPPGYAEAEAAELRAFDESRPSGPRPGSSRRRKS